MTQDQDERIRDVCGRTIGLIRQAVDKELVCDRSGRILGFLSQGSTFKKTGERIALGEQAGLLLHGEDDDL